MTKIEQWNLDIMTKDAIIGEYSKIVATIANFMGRKIFS